MSWFDRYRRPRVAPSPELAEQVSGLVRLRDELGPKLEVATRERDDLVEQVRAALADDRITDAMDGLFVDDHLVRRLAPLHRELRLVGEKAWKLQRQPLEPEQRQALQHVRAYVFGLERPREGALREEVVGHLRQRGDGGRGPGGAPAPKG